MVEMKAIGDTNTLEVSPPDMSSFRVFLWLSIQGIRIDGQKPLEHLDADINGGFSARCFG